MHTHKTDEQAFLRTLFPFYIPPKTKSKYSGFFKFFFSVGLAVTFEKTGTRTCSCLRTIAVPVPPPTTPVKQMLVLEVSLIRPTFSARGVERGGASLMYGTRCPLPDVVQADMQVWHEASFQGRP